jgi:DNA repair protein RecO (recombination protein O)
MKSHQVIEGEPAYLIHQRPYSETSQIINLFSRHYGRVDAIAKGSKRPKSKFKSFLQPFSPILVSWSGRSQLKTLRSVDISSGKQSNVSRKHLMSAFYLNELILSFLTTADPYPDLFDAYSLAINNLSNADSSEIILREFEIQLLTEIGYAINFQTEAMSSKKIEPNLSYRFIAEEGFVSSVTSSARDALIKGSVIQSIDRKDFSQPETMRAAKRIIRESVKYHLSGKELNTKKVVKSLKKSI